MAPATAVTVADPETIRATTPPGLAGSAEVVVTNPDRETASLAMGFTYRTGGAISGDASGDCHMNVMDVFYLVNHLFAGGAAPAGSGDVNGDGFLNASRH